MGMSKREIYTIGAYFDGRPGHEKQTTGILEQLKKQVQTKVIPVNVRKGNVSQQIIDWKNFLLSSRNSINRDLADCDLLIGTGTHTHLPMLMQKSCYGMVVIACMTPTVFLQSKFDLIIAPQHDNIGEGKNVFKTIGPPNLNQDKGEHRSERTLILIGGVDPHSHHWVNNEIIGYLHNLIVHEVEKEIIISSSPRTPTETTTSLVKLAEEFSHVSFFDYRDTPSGWVEKEYSLCEHVWVTGDSISMVYEALSSGCKVGIIPVRWRKKISKFITSERYLYDQEMVIDLQGYLSNRKTWKEHPALNEAKRCADEIISRFL
jgi:uncharacterized protein